MDNTNVNPSQSTAQGADLSDVMKLFSDYEKKSDDTPKLSKENLLAKYFTPRNSVENFRILPPLAGRDIIEKAFFHYVPVNKPVTSGKGWRKIYCSAHNSPSVPKLDVNGQPIRSEQGTPVMVQPRCPLCEKAKSIEATLDNSIKYIKKENRTPEQNVIAEKNKLIYKDMGKWEAKKYSLVRGIDKGMPKDGVKFWRFKENFKNQGVLDKLVPALRLFHEQYGKNPTDVNEGSDLYINVVDSRMPNGSPYKDVSSITAKNPSRLYDDPIVIKQWLGDQSTWRDVFKEASMTRVLNSEQYLDRVVKGTDPYWDDRNQDNKRYVFPDPADAELMSNANEKSESLDADTYKNYEVASDIASNVVGNSYGVNIGNVSTEDVGVDLDNSMDVGSQFQPINNAVAAPVVQQPIAQAQVVQPQSNQQDDIDLDDYDDLPF